MSRKMTEEALKIIRDVHELFTGKGLKLSVAESCTGGLISHYLTWLPGASRFFEAGVVTYSVSSKENILGVSSETISSYGVVSRETAKEMAEKIRLLTGTDYALSTTGNLGPDILEGKERGLVYAGISKEGKTIIKELRLKGTRIKNREDAALLSLKFLMDELSGQR
ncbi:MAG: CinA family protein [Nitrospira bacterium HGW-Nitrospira-1]|nr:MAG: CinA family protein [Nitrospira bacterium HGW-Nitrospira-1]